MDEAPPPTIVTLQIIWRTSLHVIWRSEPGGSGMEMAKPRLRKPVAVRDSNATQFRNAQPQQIERLPCRCKTEGLCNQGQDMSIYNRKLTKNAQQGRRCIIKDPFQGTFEKKEMRTMDYCRCCWESWFGRCAVSGAICAGQKYHEVSFFGRLYTAGR
jgi:hypothetical protein